MSVLDRLNVDNAASAASATLHEYVSDRSVALLLRPTPTQLAVGSGTCVQIGKRFLVVTAGHNLRGVALDKIRAIPRGSSSERELRPMAGRRRGTPDIGWLELDAEAVVETRLRSVRLQQLAPLPNLDPEPVVAHVQGFPGARTTASEDVSDRPHLQSLGLLTPVIPPRERSTIAVGIDFSVEYPPWDQSIDFLALGDPRGLSGGGVWRVPVFRDDALWTPEDARLNGLVESWQARTKELFCVRIERWLQAVREDIPEVAFEIDALTSNWALGG